MFRTADSHDWIVNELYSSESDFKRQTLINVLRVVGNTVVVSAFLGHQWDAWEFGEAVAAIFIVPSAAIAISWLAAIPVLLIVLISPSKFGLTNRKQARPLTVAVSLVGGLILFANLLGPLMFALQNWVWEQSGWTMALGVILYITATIILITTLLKAIVLIPFHVENSNYGTPLLTTRIQRLAATSFAISTAIASIIAYKEGTAATPLVIAVLISLLALFLTLTKEERQ